MSQEPKNSPPVKGEYAEGGRGLVPKLRFLEFREAGEWEENDLGIKTSKVGSGITPRGGDRTYKKSGRPFIRSQNVGWGELLLDDVAFIDDEAHASFITTEISNLDVLLNITGASIGRSAVADERIVGGNVNQHVCIIRTIKNELNPMFLNQFLISEYGQNQIDSFQAGGNRQGLNFAQVRSFSIPIPPTMDEQIKVSACLSSIDELITAEAQKLDTLKAHKTGLMQQLFPAEGETLPKLRFPEFRDVGEWEEKTLEQVATYENGKAHENNISDKGQYIVVNSKFISTEGEIRKYSDDAFCIADVGDVLMVLSDVPNGRAIAKCYFVESDNLYTVNQRICKIKPNEIDGKFLFYILDRNPFFLASDDGVKQTNLRKEDVLNCPLYLPSLPEEQKKISHLVSSIDELIIAEAQKLDALKAHKKGLMQQLFPALDEVQG